MPFHVHPTCREQGHDYDRVLTDGARLVERCVCCGLLRSTIYDRPHDSHNRTIVSRQFDYPVVSDPAPVEGIRRPAAKLIGGWLDPADDGRHPCIAPGCGHTVQFDDEPWCFSHSPDEGSSVRGYSYRQHGSRVPS